ncbi:MAG TPA: aldo/keto reductase [Treponema sp.]|nr:aldo/keto reductase [Treponema sp.]
MKRQLALLAALLLAAALFANGKTTPAAPTVRLNSGYEMPVLGLGTWTLDAQTAEESVYTALKNGYRLIDTARYYHNEQGVGKGVRRAISDGLVTREDVFVTTKIWGAYAPEKAIEDANAALGLGYIDLLLIHQPSSDDRAMYTAMEKAVRAGTVRSIGISNYYTKKQFDEIMGIATIVPAVIQNENHPFYQNEELQDYVKKWGVYVESYYPLGGRGHTQDLFGNRTIAKIAAAHGKSSAQILLRWHVQSGYIAIPGSSNARHIAENISIFDFALSKPEMEQIRALHTGKRYETW